jgi:hypothetical protein
MIDWYQGTIQSSAEHVTGELLHAYGLFSELAPYKAQHNYYHGAELRVRGEPQLHIFHGGNGGGTHFRASGYEARQAHSLITRLFPNNLKISRIDDAIDYIADDAWDSLYRIVMPLIEKHGLTYECVGDWIKGENGRTLYIGSRNSERRICMYEKGKEQRQKKTNPDADPNWVRLELRTQPHKRNKKAVAQLSPPELWASARWTHDLAQRLGNSELERTHLTAKTASQNPEYWLIRNYGNLLATKLGHLGSPEALGREIASLLAKHGIDPETDSMST